MSCPRTDCFYNRTVFTDIGPQCAYKNDTGENRGCSIDSCDKYINEEDIKKMGKGPGISKEKRQQVVRLLLDGKPVTEIEKVTGISHGTIYKLKKQTPNLIAEEFNKTKEPVSSANVTSPEAKKVSINSVAPEIKDVNNDVEEVGMFPKKTPKSVIRAAKFELDRVKKDKISLLSDIEICDRQIAELEEWLLKEKLL